MIEFKNVVKKYENNVTVGPLNFKINPREIYSIIGPSGCGKTTTLKLINQLVEQTSGEILIDSSDIKKLNKQKIRKNIGYVVQNIGLFPHLTIKGNLKIVNKKITDEEIID